MRLTVSVCTQWKKLESMNEKKTKQDRFWHAQSESLTIIVSEKQKNKKTVRHTHTQFYCNSPSREKISIRLYISFSLFAEWANVDHTCVSACDVVIQAAVFSGVCVCVCVCRFSCLYDKWQPHFGLRGRAAQMDSCLCPFFFCQHNT